MPVVWQPRSRIVQLQPAVTPARAETVQEPPMAYLVLCPRNFSGILNFSRPSIVSPEFPKFDQNPDNSRPRRALRLDVQSKLSAEESANSDRLLDPLVLCPRNFCRNFLSPEFSPEFPRNFSPELPGIKYPRNFKKIPIEPTHCIFITPPSSPARPSAPCPALSAQRAQSPVWGSLRVTD
jgi:hypothetical protein